MSKGIFKPSVELDTYLCVHLSAEQKSCTCSKSYTGVSESSIESGVKQIRGSGDFKIMFAPIAHSTPKLWPCLILNASANTVMKSLGYCNNIVHPLTCTMLQQLANSLRMIVIHSHQQRCPCSCVLSVNIVNITSSNNCKYLLENQTNTSLGLEYMSGNLIDWPGIGTTPPVIQ